jgi:hypothetical protein
LTPDVYHYLCSLKRCYFFFVLRFLSLQTRGFPLKTGGSPTTFWLPRHGGTSSNTGVGYIVLLYLLSADRCTFACGDLTGILYLHSRKDYTSTSFVIYFVIWQYLSGSTVLCQFCLPWTLLQEAFPLKHFWC